MLLSNEIQKKQWVVNKDDTMRRAMRRQYRSTSGNCVPAKHNGRGWSVSGVETLPEENAENNAEGTPDRSRGADGVSGGQEDQGWLEIPDNYFSTFLPQTARIRALFVDD